MSIDMTRAYAFTSASLLALSAATLPALAVQNAPNTGDDSSRIMQQTPHPSVIVFNQKAAGDSVKLTYAYLPKDGYVVIYGTDQSGKPTGAPLGHVAIKAGDSRDVMVKLATAPKKGERLWASLYTEANKDTTFDKEDAAAWKVSELPHANMFMID